MDDRAPAPPDRVTKRDGRIVVFDADKISRALFAAGESLGRANAFLARELTDGVVHFLSLEGDETPTTAQIADLVVKVVRELGQPELAEAFAEQGRRRVRGLARPAAASATGAREVTLRFPAGMPAAAVLAACARSYTLQSVYARDLVAAQAEGLLALTGLEHPGALEGSVLAPCLPWHGGADGLAAAIEAARAFTGRFVALDGPEFISALDAPAFARELAVGLRVARLAAVVNLNAATPPPWADDLAGGPLFADQPASAPAERRAALADALLDELSRPGSEAVRIDWHLGERDFAPATRERLERVVRLALEGQRISFVFDRPRRPVALAEGISRPHAAVLLTVGLHLPCLAAQTGVGGDPTRFLQKLASLVRLALSAGTQKRAFLRSQADVAAVTSGFLLDRARLVVAPLGLEAVARSFFGHGLAADGASRDFARQIVVRLREVARQDGQRLLLETCLDGPASFGLDAVPPEANAVAGLTPWDATASLRAQLRAASSLHAATESGTLALFLPDDTPPNPTAAADWLHTAWQRSDVVRLRLLSPSLAQGQFEFAG